MAFGALKGGLTASNISIPDPFSATGSVSVAVGDLIRCVIGEQTSLTTVSVSDNLGHSYTAFNAGVTSSVHTAIAYWVIATSAGTLTSVDANTTSSSHNAVIAADVFEGPFDAASPLDANPAIATGDVTTPFTCPATGTLAQADELVLNWAVRGGAIAFAATAPMAISTQIAASALISTALGYQVVAATTSVVSEFTGTGTPSDMMLGTASFKRARQLSVVADAFSVAATFANAGLLHGSKFAADAASYAATFADASLLRGFKVAADAASYTATFADATLTYTPVAGSTYTLVADAFSSRQPSVTQHCSTHGRSRRMRHHSPRRSPMHRCFTAREWPPMRSPSPPRSAMRHCSVQSRSQPARRPIQHHSEMLR